MKPAPALAATLAPLRTTPRLRRAEGLTLLTLHSRPGSGRLPARPTRR